MYVLELGQEDGSFIYAAILRFLWGRKLALVRSVHGRAVEAGIEGLRSVEIEGALCEDVVLKGVELSQKLGEAGEELGGCTGEFSDVATTVLGFVTGGLDWRPRDGWQRTMLVGRFANSVSLKILMAPLILSAGKMLSSLNSVDI